MLSCDYFVSYFINRIIQLRSKMLIQSATKQMTLQVIHAFKFIQFYLFNTYLLITLSNLFKLIYSNKCIQFNQNCWLIQEQNKRVIEVLLNYFGVKMLIHSVPKQDDLQVTFSHKSFELFTQPLCFKMLIFNKQNKRLPFWMSHLNYLAIQFV